MKPVTLLSLSRISHSKSSKNRSLASAEVAYNNFRASNFCILKSKLFYDLKKSVYDEQEFEEI